MNLSSFHGLQKELRAEMNQNYTYKKNPFAWSLPLVAMARLEAATQIFQPKATKLDRGYKCVHEKFIHNYLGK